ncbi:MAG: ankyrin repeat domain-containing protein [Alphaproteobacteria bacterium]|nr:ankyrin repeat domain-containing protein [Alphaproteobacteria bacterium]
MKKLSPTELGARLCDELQCVKCDEDKCLQLIADGADIHYHIDHLLDKPIFLATARGHDRVVRALIEKGVDVNEEDSPHRKQTPLQKSVVPSGCSFETIGFMLDKGANIDHQNIAGITALMIAARCKDKDLVRFLLDRGADIHLATFDIHKTSGFKPQTAADIADQKGYKDIADMIRYEEERRIRAIFTPLALAGTPRRRRIIRPAPKTGTKDKGPS